jgi:preprotein translocase subunit SecG
MQFLMSFIQVAQIVSALGIILLVLLQHGKGADMGAAFGSGASGTLFGATGSANALSRATAIAATLFFVCTLALAYFGSARQSTSNEGEQSLLTGSAPAASSAASAALSGAAAIPGAAPALAPASTAASQP